MANFAGVHMQCSRYVIIDPSEKQRTTSLRYSSGLDVAIFFSKNRNKFERFESSPEIVQKLEKHNFADFIFDFSSIPSRPQIKISRLLCVANFLSYS